MGSTGGRTVNALRDRDIIGLSLAYSFEQATKVRRLPKHTPLRAGDTIAVP